MSYDNTNHGVLFPQKDGSWKGSLNHKSGEPNCDLYGTQTEDGFKLTAKYRSNGQTFEDLMIRTQSENPQAPVGRTNLGKITKVAFVKRNAAGKIEAIQLRPDNRAVADELPF